MRFTQPNSRTRAIHQVVDQLLAGARVSLTFQTEREAAHGLSALHEVAVSRRVGVQVEATGPRTVEADLVEPWIN